MLTQRRTDSVRAAANKLGISAPTAYRRIADGTFPVPFIKIGRRIVVPVDPLERLLSGEMLAAASPPDPPDEPTDDEAPDEAA